MAKRRKFTSAFKTELVLAVLSGATSQAELCRRHNLNEDQLSKWKQQFLEKAPTLFEATDKQSSDAEKRIAHLEQLVGRMETVALDIQKKLLTWLDSRYPKSDASFQHCDRSTPCEIFVVSSVSTVAVSIITTKRIHPKRCYDQK